MTGPTDEPATEEPTFLSFAALNLHRGDDGAIATSKALDTVTGFLAAIGADVQHDGGIVMVMPATDPEDHPVAYRIGPDGKVTQSVFAVHYTSTACTHDRHDQCRHTCKWCDETCRCSCHGPNRVTPPPPDFAEQVAAVRAAKP